MLLTELRSNLILQSFRKSRRSELSIVACSHQHQCMQDLMSIKNNSRLDALASSWISCIRTCVMKGAAGEPEMRMGGGSMHGSCHTLC